jgi:hypothetical protein
MGLEERVELLRGEIEARVREEPCPAILKEQADPSRRPATHRSPPPVPYRVTTSPTLSRSLAASPTPSVELLTPHKLPSFTSGKEDKESRKKMKQQADRQMWHNRHKRTSDAYHALCRAEPFLKTALYAQRDIKHTERRSEIQKILDHLDKVTQHMVDELLASDEEDQSENGAE